MVFWYVLIEIAQYGSDGSDLKRCLNLVYQCKILLLFFSQEVNKMDDGLGSQANRVMTTETISAEELVTIHPALTEAVMTTSPADTCQYIFGFFSSVPL